MSLVDNEKKVQSRLDALTEVKRSYVETLASERVRDVPTYLSKLRFFWLGLHHLYMGNFARVVFIWGALIYAVISVIDGQLIGVVPLLLVWLIEIPTLISKDKRVRESNVDAYISALAHLKKR